MIEVQVPKDIFTYEAPFIGPLTARQTLCVAIAAAAEYIYYSVVQYLGIQLDTNSLICIGIVIAMPILYFAAAKPYGMRPEVYVYNYLLPSLIAPKNRPYETKLVYDSILEEIEKQEEAIALAESNGKNGSKNNKKNNTKNASKKPQKKKARGKQDIMYK